MELTKATFDDLSTDKQKQKKRGPKPQNGKLQKTIRKFIESDMDIAEIHWKDDYNDLNSAYRSFRSTISREFREEVRIAKRDTKIYLVMKELGI